MPGTEGEKAMSTSDDRQNRLDALLGRALRDREFREKLIANPSDAAKEANLTPDELKLVAGGLAIGSALNRPGTLFYCTEKTCNEKGGARVIMFSPDPAFNPTIIVEKAPGTTGKG